MQRVDPFIPITSPRTPIVPPKSVPQLVKYPAATARNTERPRAAQLQPPRASKPAVLEVKVKQSSSPSQQPKKTSWGRSGDRLKTTGLVLVILAAGACAGVLAVGEALIATYAIYAFVRRLKSRTTFMLVLVSLATVMVLRATGKDAVLASNFAVYSLLLAFIGIVSLAREVRTTTR